MATLTRPHSSAKGLSRPRSCRHRSARRSSSKRNGTPCSTLPTATPKISAGTKPPMNSAQSQTLRQRGVVQLGAELEADRPQDERQQHHEHGEIEAGEGRRIERRPGGEDRAAAEDEPDLVAFPDRADRVDQRRGARCRSGRRRAAACATPRSKPSMTAKPISSTPSSTHQIRRRIS